MVDQRRLSLQGTQSSDKYEGAVFTRSLADHTAVSGIAMHCSMLMTAIPEVEISTVIIYLPDGANVCGSRGGKFEGIR